MPHRIHNLSKKDSKTSLLSLLAKIKCKKDSKTKSTCNNDGSNHKVLEVG